MKRDTQLVILAFAVAGLLVAAAYTAAESGEWPALEHGVLSTVSAPAAGAPAHPAAKASDNRALDTAKIENLTGVKGKYDINEQTFRVSEPRGDLRVFAEGVRVTPAMGLESWAAFRSLGRSTLATAAFTLAENEVNPVLTVALDNGLDVVSLHNALLGDSPRIMTLRIEGAGDQFAMAAAIGKVFGEIKAAHREPLERAAIDPARTRLDIAKLQTILRERGALNEGVYKFVSARQVDVAGKPIGADMGVGDWAAFIGSDERAVVSGGFAVPRSALRLVLQALRGSNIEIASIDQHMTDDKPRMLYVDFWGVGSAENLAKGLRAALDHAGPSPVATAMK